MDERLLGLLVLMSGVLIIGLAFIIAFKIQERRKRSR